MKKKKILKILLILFVVGLVSGSASVYYLFNMPERNIARERATLSTSAEELYAMFEANEDETYQKLGNRVLEVSGEIVEKMQNGSAITITLGDVMEGVSCSFDSTYVTQNADKMKSLREGSQIKVKGKCDGYDMIMGVVLTKCLIIPQPE